MKYTSKILVLSLLPLLLCGCSAEHWATIDTVLDHIKANYYWVSRMLVALAYLMGLFFIYGGIQKLRAFGQVRTMMPSNAELSGPIIEMFIGILLMALPTVIEVSVYSLWGTSGLAPYPTYSSKHLDAEAWDAIFGFVRIMGFIALIRGLVIMARAAKKGSQPGTTGKGFIHLVGGVLAINIGGTISIIQASFGL